MAPCTLVAFLSASIAIAQVPPAMGRDESAIESSAAEPQPPPTRPIVFTPDKPEAQLEFRGIGLVDGVWKDGWIPVCVGECAGLVPLGEKYRVNGPGIHRSRQFEIGPGRTPLYIEARTGSTAGNIVGIGAVVLGAVALPAGLLAWGFSGTCIGDGGERCPDPEPQRSIGILMAIGGAIALVTGIVQVVQNRTVVTGDEPRAQGR